MFIPIISIFLQDYSLRTRQDFTDNKNKDDLRARFAIQSAHKRRQGPSL